MSCYSVDANIGFNRHFNDLPKSEATRIQINTQIRIQQMLTFIYKHYAEPVTLDDIARAADISRNEAGRLTDLCTHAAVSVVTKGDPDDANGCNLEGNTAWL